MIHPDPTNPVHKEAAHRLSDFISQRQKLDIKNVLATKSGRSFVWRILEESKVFGRCMTGNNQTFFNLGMREIGLKLIGWANEVDPEAYGLMQSEAAERAEMERMKFSKELKNGR